MGHCTPGVGEEEQQGLQGAGGAHWHHWDCQGRGMGSGPALQLLCPVLSGQPSEIPGLDWCCLSQPGLLGLSEATTQHRVWGHPFLPSGSSLIPLGGTELGLNLTGRLEVNFHFWLNEFFP